MPRQREKIVGKLELHYTLEIFFSKLSLRFMFMKSHEKLRFWFKMMIEVQENRNWPKAISRVVSRVSGQQTNLQNHSPTMNNHSMCAAAKMPSSHFLSTQPTAIKWMQNSTSSTKLFCFFDSTIFYHAKLYQWVSTLVQRQKRHVKFGQRFTSRIHNGYKITKRSMVFNTISTTKQNFKFRQHLVSS